MKPKRIAIISYHTCPLASQEGKQTGGMNVYVYEMAKSLGNLGIFVDIFTRSESPMHQKIVRVSPFVQVVHLVAGPENALAKNEARVYVDAFADAIIQFMEKEIITYNIIHSHYYLSGLAGLRVIKHIRSTPHVITFHTLALMKNLIARDNSEIEDTIRISAEYDLAQKVDYVIALSESDRKYISYLYDIDISKIAVAAPGVDTEIFKPADKKIARGIIGAGQSNKIILFVGRIEPLKGIDSLLYAMKIIANRSLLFQREISLWIVGGDVSQEAALWSSELKKLSSLCKVLGLKTVVNFIGKKPQKELPLYYSAADVVVMPSHYETFGIVALEALACGASVISTHVSGVTSMIENRRDLHIVPANSPLHLATQIETILSTNDSRPQCSPIILKGMGWDRTATHCLSVYTRINHL